MDSPERKMESGKRPSREPRFGKGVSRNNKGGAVYVIALAAMVVGISFAVAMLGSSGTLYIGEQSRSRSQAAADVAEAGVDYAYWQIHYNAQKLPYSATVSLTTGSFSVSVSDNGAQTKSTMLITSTGTVGSHKNVIKRVDLGLLPYDYLWCEDTSVNTGQCVTASGSQGGIRSNSSINLSKNTTNVKCGAWAATTITTTGAITPQNPNSPAITYPSIDYNYYDSIANATYNWNSTFYGINTSHSGYVVVVNGNVTISLWSGYYTGVCTIVATGNITIDGWLLPSDSTSHLALITTGQITADTSAFWVQAIMYAHKSDNTAQIHLQASPVWVSGSLAADNVNTDNSITLQPDTTCTLAVFRQLQMPGLAD